MFSCVTASPNICIELCRVHECYIKSSYYLHVDLTVIIDIIIGTRVGTCAGTLLTILPLYIQASQIHHDRDYPVSSCLYNNEIARNKMDLSAPVWILTPPHCYVYSAVHYTIW